MPNICAESCPNSIFYKVRGKTMDINSLVFQATAHILQIEAFSLCILYTSEYEAMRQIPDPDYVCDPESLFLIVYSGKPAEQFSFPHSFRTLGICKFCLSIHTHHQGTQHFPLTGPHQRPSEKCCNRTRQNPVLHESRNFHLFYTLFHPL